MSFKTLVSKALPYTLMMTKLYPRYEKLAKEEIIMFLFGVGSSIAMLSLHSSGTTPTTKRR
jgi:hypothetical protein